MLTQIAEIYRQFPHYGLALLAAVGVLASAVPVYGALWYLLWRRRLRAPLALHISVLGVFGVFAIFAFLQSSPLSVYLNPVLVTLCLAAACILAAVAIVLLVDVFVILYYISTVQKIYVSPPLRAVIKLAVFGLALLPILNWVLHFDPLALVAIPTVATAGLALALQDTLKAFIAGVGLGRVIRIGDTIAFEGSVGRVVDINWARTVLFTDDSQHVYIPNSRLQTGTFINYTAGDSATRACLKVGAGYEVPPARVKSVLAGCATGVDGVAAAPAPFGAVVDYADSSVQYGLYYWLADYSRRVPVHDELSTRVWYAFRREGFPIPYPTRTVHLRRTPEAQAQARLRAEEALQRWVLAEAFYAEELRELSASTSTRLYAPGEFIVRAGDVGFSLFVVSEGEVDIFAPAQPEKPFTTLGKGEIFGEMSILTGAPRSASVSARTAVEVIEIQKAALQKIISHRPEVSERLAELVVRRQAALAALSQSGGGPGPAGGLEDAASLARKIRQFFGLN